VSILSTKKLAKHFDGVKAVGGVSIELNAGEVVGLVGPNGSGKSTLINLLTGVIRNSSGTMQVDSVSKKKIYPYDASYYGLTRTFQDVRIFEQMSVLDNILVVLTERSVFSAFFERHKEYHLDKAKGILEKVNLWHKKEEMASSLSYGQRKLLEVARVLAMCESGHRESEIIFFDEPFAGLFPEIVKVVMNIIRELKQKGKTIVLVEHNMEIIRELSDRVIVMDSGEILAEGDPEKVLNQRNVIEAYLGD